MAEKDPRDLLPAWRRRRASLEPDKLLAAEIERPRAVLTSDDRSFLLDDPLKPEDHERSERARTGKISRIRKRVRHALLDFTLLDQCLDAEDRKRIFDPTGRAEESSDEILGSVVGLVAFLYAGHQDAGYQFEDSLYAGVREAERRDGWVVDPEFSIGTRRSTEDVGDYPLPPLVVLSDEADEADEPDEDVDTDTDEGADDE